MKRLRQKVFRRDLWGEVFRRHWHRIWLLGMLSAVCMLFHPHLVSRIPYPIARQLVGLLAMPWIIVCWVLCSIALRHSNLRDHQQAAFGTFTIVVLGLGFVATLMMAFRWSITLGF